MSVQASLSLGAYDLKKAATRSLAIAFLISLLFHLVILGGNEVLDIVMGSSDEGEENIVATGPVTLNDFKEEMKEEEQPPAEDIIPPPPPMAATAEVGSGSEGAMGNLVATENVVDGPDIADMSEIEFSNAIGGGDGGAKPLDTDISMPEEKLSIKPESAAPTTEYGMDEFVPNVQDATYSLAELKSLIKYPEIAKENNIEGSVIVSAQVSTTGGRPIKVVVRDASNKMFEAAAKQAVEKLKFTPATQNGHPIKKWMTVTVKFELED